MLNKIQLGFAIICYALSFINQPGILLSNQGFSMCILRNWKIVVSDANLDLFHGTIAQTDNEKEQKISKTFKFSCKRVFCKISAMSCAGLQIIARIININLQLSLADWARRRERFCLTRLNTFCFQNCAKFSFNINC